MPVTETNLTAGGHTGDQSSYTTNSISPSANKLVIAYVGNQASASQDFPSLSGNGLTWVQVNSVTPSSTSRFTVFRAMGGSPSAGQVTIDYGGVNQLRCCWVICEFGNVDTTGANGAGAIVQQIGTNATGTSITATLSAFSSVDNATAGGFHVLTNDAFINEGSGFSQTGQVTQIESTACLGTWRNTNDTSVDASWSTSGNAGAFGLEIKFDTGVIIVPGPRIMVVMA